MDNKIIEKFRNNYLVQNELNDISDITQLIILALLGQENCEKYELKHNYSLITNLEVILEKAKKANDFLDDNLRDLLNE